MASFSGQSTEAVVMVDSIGKELLDERGITIQEVAETAVAGVVSDCTRYQVMQRPNLSRDSASCQLQSIIETNESMDTVKTICTGRHCPVAYLKQAQSKNFPREAAESIVMRMANIQSKKIRADLALADFKSA